MSKLTLAEAVRAPLQTDRVTRYGAGTHAVLARGELFYYRRAECYRDWIEVFTHRGYSLGGFRSLDHFIGEWPDRHSDAANSETRALLAQIRPLVGHRVVAAANEEIDTGLSPAPVLRFDDGRILAILADAEGNGGGFPDVSKPQSPQHPSER
jgi:hypothetical protein